MYRSPLDLLRLFLSLFQDLPPLSRSLYLPGAVLLIGYPVLSVLLGPDHNGQAFATAFLAALAVKIGMGFEGMVKRMLTRYSPTQAVVFALLFAGLPLAVLALADDPLWCQRMQSLFYVVIAGVFLQDVLNGRTATAASFWPHEEMRAHLPNLTKMMVVYNFTFLMLNETMIRLVEPSQWLLFWAVLPVIGHMVLRAMVLTVINLDAGHEA
ncbi:hypothetical protein [Tabrizicola sp.]|uniref:hypothetical protein n=1 Tax=Tabrizicola sp. TaxID=2005166 RepID=UPI00273370E0|nr:hypothetical protein [Tabrizicola sp.]MDP3197038.1 hypothetical protein [Tabrizicola sp.]